MSEVAIEVLERLAEADDRVMRGGLSGSDLESALDERERALSAYRAAKAAAEPKLRTRAEVDADIAAVTRQMYGQGISHGARLNDLCIEKTRQSDPAPERMTEAERAPHHGWQEHAVRDERRKQRGPKGCPHIACEYNCPCPVHGVKAAPGPAEDKCGCEEVERLKRAMVQAVAEIRSLDLRAALQALEFALR